MAMFLSHHKFLVLLVIELLLNSYENEQLGKRRTTTVDASGNTEISGVLLEIEKRPMSKLIITDRHHEHYIECKATFQKVSFGKYIPNYSTTWYRDGKKLNVRRNDFGVKNGTLRLPAAEKAKGKYYCEVQVASIAVISESITVEYPILKRISNIDSNITVASGSMYTFSCPIMSVPPANITWFYNNVTLIKRLEDNRYEKLPNGSLLIMNLTTQDSGKYRCQAENRYANKTHRQVWWDLIVDDSVHVNVSSALSTSYGQLAPPLQNETQYVEEGHVLKLRCRSVHNLVPIEWWYKRLTTAAAEKLLNYSNEYQIRNASEEIHEGFYICSTPRDSQTFHVIVTIAPTIMKRLPSYKTHIAASLTFNCCAVGNPKPNITWYHNAIPISSSLTRYITGSELSIYSFDPDEEGIYQCFARNIAGEVSTEGEIRRNTGPMEEPMQNPLQNIRCYAHSSNTINITFDRVSSPLYFISVHIVQKNPYRWTSIPPLEPNHSSYIVISNHLPVYRPFELITRALLRTTNVQPSSNHNPNEERILSSLRSQPVTCCTQGLPLHIVNMHNDTYVTWSQPDFTFKKYFVLQFSGNYTRPHPMEVFKGNLRGTMKRVELNREDVSEKLTELKLLDSILTRRIMKQAGRQYSDNDSIDSDDDPEGDIFNLIMPANVTGILMPNCTKIKMRVLIITAENENLRQDFRYVQWKIIENDTAETSNLPFRLTKIESRMIAFVFQDSFTEKCVHVCYSQIQFPIIGNEESMCEERKIINSQLEVRSLKPTKWYRLNFSSCKTQVFYGQKEVLTLADPPGTISNQRIIKQNGLKLIWDPPIHSNGKIYHYNILWTLDNITHETNVFDCTDCFYKFPHASETSKINITVRVVGENGIGAPIFIDLRDINHRTLEVERSSNSEVYSGIAIGAALSMLCVLFFTLLIIYQRRRFKSRQQPPSHLTSQSETNFGNLSTASIPGDSASALSGNTIQHDCHEMQTLIPRSRYNQLLNRHALEYQSTQLVNGNGNIPRREEPNKQPYVLKSTTDDHIEQSKAGGNAANITASANKFKDATIALKNCAKPYFIPFKAAGTSETTLGKHNSSPNFQNCTWTSPPSSLPAVTPAEINERRSGSLSSGDASKSLACSSNGSCRNFHTNFQKHSNSNDGICLLAEEESMAILTPTSETENATNAGTVQPYSARSSQTTTLVSNRSKCDHPTETSNSHLLKATCTVSTTPNAKFIFINNNNQKCKHSIETQQSKLTKQPPQLALCNEPAVPSSNSLAMIPPPTVKHWATTAAATNLYRRPNVDPNG